jgi:serine/threonine protein kinase
LDIVHGNLNSDNIILDSQGCVKLSEYFDFVNITVNERCHAYLVDFGLSAKVEREQLNRVGPIEWPYWTAPEFIANEKYSSAMDIWSLGIVSIEMVEKQPPYFDKDPYIARESIAKGGTPTLKSPKTLPQELIYFLSSCLVGNTRERATASELCSVGILLILDMVAIG